jgi:hypothetical protein
MSTAAAAAAATVHATKKERKKESQQPKLPFSRRVHVSTRRRQWERSHGPSGIRKLGLRLPALNNMPVFFFFSPLLYFLSLSFLPPSLSPPPLSFLKSNFHYFLAVLFMWRKREDLFFAKKQNGKWNYQPILKGGDSNNNCTYLIF